MDSKGTKAEMKLSPGERGEGLASSNGGSLWEVVSRTTKTANSQLVTALKEI